MLDLPESEIIKKIQNGEINYFELLVKKYSKILYYYIRKKVAGEDDAKDVLQNAFINSYKAIERFNHAKPFYPFIFSIVKNEINQFYRKNKKAYSFKEEIEINNNDLEDNKIDLDLLFKKIKPQSKKMLKLYYLDGYSYKEISQKLKKPINTVKTLLRRAKIEAKEKYEK